MNADKGSAISRTKNLSFGMRYTLFSYIVFVFATSDGSDVQGWSIHTRTCTRTYSSTFFSSLLYSVLSEIHEYMYSYLLKYCYKNTVLMSTLRVPLSTFF